jgi:hypothetical protein
MDEPYPSDVNLRRYALAIAAQYGGHAMATDVVLAAQRYYKFLKDGDF